MSWRTRGLVIRIVSGIADLTDLLALNATIEAARAGEFGKDSAVVSSEVEDLAREAANATERVSDHDGPERTGYRAVLQRASAVTGRSVDLP